MGKDPTNYVYDSGLGPEEFLFRQVNINQPPPRQPDEDSEEQGERNKKREKYSSNKKKKEIVNRINGMLTECLLCGQPILKKGEEGNNESFKIQLAVINDEDTGIEQYQCGLCSKHFTIVVSKNRVKVAPIMQMQPE